MCDPVSISFAALAIVSTVVQQVGASNAADAQQDALTTQAEARAEELGASLETEAGERVKQSRIERSRMQVAGGEAGVAGQSFELGILQSFADQNQDLAILQKQGAFSQRGANAQTASAFSQINRPSAVGSALQIASSAAAGAQSGLQVSSALKAGEEG